MENRPLITSVVTTYDRPVQVRTAIRSVLEQTYDHTELLVVEDGTETSTREWLHQQGEERVRYIRHETNKGLAAARNTGIREAQGDYIAFLDDDDRWKSNRLERQIHLLASLTPEERDALGVIYCLVESQYPSHVHVSDPKSFNRGNLRRAILKQRRLTIPPSSALFAAQALRDVGGFDETLDSSIDHDIWMSLAEGGYHGFVVEEPLVVNDRTGEETMVTNTQQRIRGVRQFVDKWEPVLVNWMGPDDGVRFARQYLIRVLGKLLRDNLRNLNWADARRTLAALVRETGIPLYTLWYVSYNVIRGIFGMLPRQVQYLVRVLMHKSGVRSSSIQAPISA